MKRLMCWLELVDASYVKDSKQVQRLLQSIGFGNPDCEVEGPYWDEDCATPERFSAVYWDTMPNHHAFFNELAPVLCPGEQLTFEEKVRYGMRSDSTLSLIVVESTGVNIVSGVALSDLLKLRKESP